MAKKILLADDSVTIQKVVELTFMDEDFEVVAVSNGDDAVARVGDVQPDLVIADVHMPGANGYQVCRRVKEQRPRTPVLLLVGTFEPFDANEANAAGADSYLKKPFDSQELLQRAHDLIGAAGKTPAGAITTTPADEMELWHPQDALPDETGDLYAAGAPAASEHEPAGPLSHEVPEELVLEASPWTEAEESAGAADAFAAPAQPAPAPPQPSPAAPAPPPAAPAAAASAAANGGLSDADVDRIARRVVELLGDQLVREVAWEVVPDMAELVIKDRLRELERQLEVP